MGQIQVTINGRSYTVACGDGEEAHVGRLARYVEQKVAGLVGSVGQVGDARLLLMASLIVADELAEAESALDRSNDGYSSDGRTNGSAEAAGSRLAAAAEAETARTIDLLAGRLEAIAARLEGD